MTKSLLKRWRRDLVKTVSSACLMITQAISVQLWRVLRSTGTSCTSLDAVSIVMGKVTVTDIVSDLSTALRDAVILRNIPMSCVTIEVD